jgi:Ni,Fe-hydrogenase maturation factor
MGLTLFNMKYVLCFGNPYLEDDNIAQKAAKQIKVKGVKFVACNSPEQIIDYLEKDFLILDVAKGIKKITIIDSVSKLEKSKIVSLHDFDLGFFLKLIKKMGNANKIRIIALPQKIDIDKLKIELNKILSKNN